MRERRTPKHVGSYNKNLVLEVLMKQGPKSRAEISRITKLTKTAITEIIEELLSKNFVIELGRVNTVRGRRPIKLSINPELLVLALDLSGIYIKGAIVNPKGEILMTNSLKMKKMDDLLGLIEKLYEPFKNKIIAISASIPGLLELSSGKVILSTSLNWKDFNLKEIINKNFPLPFYMQKDTNAGILAENWYGEGRNYRNFFYLLLSKGIGLGIYLNDRVLDGYDGIIGEIGHTIVEIDGKECWCEKRGCLETIASIPVIIENYNKAYDIKEILDGALMGERIESLEKALKYLGISLANVIQIFPPQAVCISGNLSLEVLKYITEKLKDHVISNIFSQLRLKITFYPSNLGENSLILGAGVLGFINYFNR
ncbi:MAG: ROK family protein [Dictyoglomaceae bacterium]|nr:ROK family protein [Dictyoglomaceae bacterium]